MVYVDASAIVKLIVEEPESSALARWVDRASAALATSVLAQVEVIRTCRRVGAAAVTEAVRTLADYDLIPVDELVLQLAADVQPRELRSLDAVHLATALSIRDELAGFVTYDDRLAAAARAAGLRVSRPA